MHLPDGILPAREWLPLAATGAAIVASVSGRFPRAADQTRLPTVGFLAAGALIVQMVNFPLFGGTSAHLNGTTLLVFVAGLEAALLGMASVLLLQALLFQDGGVLALGANYMNLVAIPALVAAAFWLAARRPGVSPRRIGLLAALAAWSGGVAGALACATQISAAGLAPWGSAALWMGGCHALVGLVEGALTAAAVATLARRGLLFERSDAPTFLPTDRRGRFAAFLALAATAAVLVPLASQHPDTLEALLARARH